MFIQQRLTLVFTILLFTAIFMPLSAAALSDKEDQPGFLVVAMDRGALGNKEVEKVFERFGQEHPATLTIIGWNEEKYKPYFISSLKELKAKGAKRVVVIPMIVSRYDAYFEKMEQTVNAAINEIFGSDSRPVLTPPLGESYLFDQILYDRIAAVSKEPEQERLVVVGLGAATPGQADKIKQELDTLLNRIRHLWKFKEVASAVYFHSQAEKPVRDEGNENALQLITKIAAKKGRTIVIPMAIGKKTDSAMSFLSRLRSTLSDLDITLPEAELIQHDNVLIWLKKTANMHSPVQPGEIGVVLMPHGSDKPWNDTVERTIEPLKVRYQVEIAYGMADYSSIQEAVSRLEAKGIKHVIFGRMYALLESMRAESDYILGLTQEFAGHNHHKADYRQLCTSIIFTSFGGYEEDPEIASALLHRVEEMSHDPADETILLLSHGSGDDQVNERWLSLMLRNAGYMERLSKKRFKSIKVASLREDWPDKMEVSLQEIKKIIEDGNRHGRVIIIPNRLAGSGPYQRVLKDMNYELNPNGIAPHSFVTHWLEREIQKAINNLGMSLSAGQASGVDVAAGEITHD